MKFEFLFDVIDKALRISEKDKKADMHLPVGISFFAISMVLVGFIFIVIALISAVYGLFFFVAATFLAAAFAFLCYKFQRIHVLSETEFRYTNFLGKERIYKFSDILAIDVSRDSRVLIMKNGRIHIEASAIISERLKQLFNKELERIHKANNAKKSVNIRSK